MQPAISSLISSGCNLTHDLHLDAALLPSGCGLSKSVFELLRFPITCLGTELQARKNRLHLYVRQAPCPPV